VRGSRQLVRSYHQRVGQGSPPECSESNVASIFKEIHMSDEQIPVVETQLAQDAKTGGDDGGCCTAPGDPDGGPDT
jgi:hypothetical protein